MIGPPVQVAYAVDDVDAAAERWLERGVGPFFVIDHIPVHDVRVRGRSDTFDHSSAYAQWGTLMVELICQHDGGDDAVVGSSGVHHVAHFVDDFATASDHLVARGHREVLYAETATGTPFAFHDAVDELGHLVEIYEHTERLARFYDMVRDAATWWTGADPVRRL